MKGYPSVLKANGYENHMILRNANFANSMNYEKTQLGFSMLMENVYFAAEPLLNAVQLNNA